LLLARLEGASRATNTLGLAFTLARWGAFPIKPRYLVSNLSGHFCALSPFDTAFNAVLSVAFSAAFIASLNTPLSAVSYFVHLANW